MIEVILIEACLGAIQRGPFVARELFIVVGICGVEDFRSVIPRTCSHDTISILCLVDCTIMIEVILVKACIGAIPAAQSQLQVR